MVESDHALARLPYNRERRVLVIGGMRRLADRLRRDGWAVDLRRAPTLFAGVMAHAKEEQPDRLVVAHPTSRSGLALVCLLYAGMKIIAPEMDAGIDLSAEYVAALTLVDGPSES